MGRVLCLFDVSLFRVGVMKAKMTGRDNGWFYSEGPQHICFEEKYCWRCVLSILNSIVNWCR